MIDSSPSIRRIAVAITLVFSTPSGASETCFSCSAASTGSCAGHEQCRGDRGECREEGCEIVSTSACSTAANVRICDPSDGLEPAVLGARSRTVLVPIDVTGASAGHLTLVVSGEDVAAVLRVTVDGSQHEVTYQARRTETGIRLLRDGEFVMALRRVVDADGNGVYVAKDTAAEAVVRVAGTRVRWRVK